MSQFWNDRYAQKEYVYGTNANIFFADELSKLNAGKILLPCEGEGRNAVFAAMHGWAVEAFDNSEEVRKKALQLGHQNNVTINYQIADAMTVEYPAESFDVVALIYAHFPTEIRKAIHQKISNWLKPNGVVLLEAFNPVQLNNDSGGPIDVTMLYTEKILSEDFAELNLEYLLSHRIYLNEGKFHKGVADVVRLIGRKKSS